MLIAMRPPFWYRWRVQKFSGPGISIRILLGFFMISFEWDSESMILPGAIRRVLFFGLIPWNCQPGQLLRGWSPIKREFYRQQEVA